MPAFSGKKILLGVTGGIAAYKSCYLARELMRLGADVRVVMTKAATKFVTPALFSAITGAPTAVNLWSDNQTTGSELKTKHISLAHWADMYVVAPATANTIAKLAQGRADNLLTALALAAPCPLVLAPSMDTDMYINEATQSNLAVLKARGVMVIPPASGSLASGLRGEGRLPEVETITAYIDNIFTGARNDLRTMKILITGGPTYEPIDAVRFIGNRSSGKMSFALAQAAALRGATVTLITGPVTLETPRNVKRIDVDTAAEMYDAVIERFKKFDALIMAAAVADFTPASPAKEKIKKLRAESSLDVKLVPTRDILAEAGARKKRKQLLVGFSLETDNAEENAKDKLRRKNLDLVVMNTLKDKGAGFGTDTNVVTLFDNTGRVEKLPKLPKFDVADAILTAMMRLKQ